MSIFKEILEQLVNVFFGAKTLVNDFEVTPEFVKKEFIKNIEAYAPLDYKVALDHTTFRISAKSWESARNSGITKIETMLNKVSAETFYFLYKLGNENDLKEIYISSLWRPNAGVHTIGIAVDLGRIESIDGESIHLFNPGNTSCPKLIDKIRKWCWKSEMINQYIGPWYTRGILGWKSGWFKNTRKYDIERQHHNHIHITIKVGR